MLKEAIPLERAQMRLRVVVSGKDARKLREKLVKLASKVECEDWESGTLNFVSRNEWSVPVCLPQGFPCLFGEV